MKHLIKTTCIVLLVGCMACTGKKGNTNQLTKLEETTEEKPFEAIHSDSVEQYVNMRYGFILYYPSSLIPQGESDNSDGQVFLSADGIKISVWSNKNTLSFANSPEEEFAFRIQCYKDDKCKISYEKRIKETYILSGKKPDGNIFYQKMVYNKTKDIFYMALLEYPEKYRKQVEEIIKISINPFPKRKDGSQVNPQQEN